MGILNAILHLIRYYEKSGIWALAYFALLNNILVQSKTGNHQDVLLTSDCSQLGITNCRYLQ